MTTAEQVLQLITELQANGKPLPEIAWTAAKACVGWSYVFGARGQLCTPSNRRSFYAKKGADHPTIKSKCRNFNGADKTPGECEKCKWYPGGRTRFFDCRGFTYWILKQVFGWTLSGDGATAQWNTAANWAQKGEIAAMPRDTLCCLFVQKGKVMEHTGFGLNDETVECSNGVQYFTARNKKWTHWAVPVCLYQPAPEQADEPEKPEETMEEKRMIVTAADGKTVNLRSSPSLNSEKGPVIAQAPIGSIVTRITETGKWSFVRWEDKQGYMLSEFLKDAPENERPDVPDTGVDLAGIKATLENMQQQIAELLAMLNGKG